jgi:signal transduction histidine kinase
MDDVDPPARGYLGGVQKLDSLRDRIRAIDPFKADVLLAAAFIVAAVIELSQLDPKGDNRAVTIAAGVIALSSLAFRRRDPLLAAGLFAVPLLAQAFLGGFLTTNSTTPFVAAILLLYSVARYADGRRFRVAAPLLAVSMTAALLIEAGHDPEEVFWAVFLFGLPLLTGRALRSRAQLQAELRERAERDEADREWRAEHAVEDERTRIAAELQALVANGLSAMVVQAETVPRTVDAGDLVRAETALAAVEATGRDALSEMRRLLGVLRRDGDALELTPQPGLPRVLALVERVHEDGLPVKLRLSGDRRRLPPGIDLTGYRVLEDALETAAEQGATATDVLIHFTSDELRVQVIDDRDGDLADRLPGLKERVSLYGGHLTVARVEEGAFRVRMNLPIEETP